MAYSYLRGPFQGVTITDRSTKDKVKCILFRGKLRDCVPAGKILQPDLMDILHHITVTGSNKGSVMTRAQISYTWALD